jgi:LmbE family N-acetylglucosaminyl deacetylase
MRQDVGVPAALERFTWVVLHAHPDDEALLTAGSMAQAAAEGHRVVLVVATDGGAGLAASAAVAEGRTLAETRLRELEESARRLGVARVVHLGFGDSGLDGLGDGLPAGVAAFAQVPVDEAAARIAAILDEERADAVSVYDAAGGYGHPDHVQVHRAGSAAAALAGTPLLLEATVPRDRLLRAIRLASRVYRFPPEFDPTSFERAFSAAGAITHRIDVRHQLAAKRASMAAHASQSTADSGDRTLAAFLRMPGPLYRRVFRTEWYVEPGRPPGDCGDLFATLRGR